MKSKSVNGNPFSPGAAQPSCRSGKIGKQMLHIENYGSFIIAIIAFQIIPGAGTISILNATARNGVGDGMRTVLGTLLGDFIYMLSAVLGLAAILSAYPAILKGAQWLGVVYLLWLGLKLLCAPSTDASTEIFPSNGRWACFRQGLTVSLTNPKVIMFFMAFFPLFLGSASTPATLLLLMGHVTIISLLYQACLVLIGSAVASRLARCASARLIANRLAGVAFIVFGVKLASNNR